MSREEGRARGVHLQETMCFEFEGRKLYVQEAFVGDVNVRTVRNVRATYAMTTALRISPNLMNHPCMSESQTRLQRGRTLGGTHLRLVGCGKHSHSHTWLSRPEPSYCPVMLFNNTICCW